MAIGRNLDAIHGVTHSGTVTMTSSGRARTYRFYDAVSGGGDGFGLRLDNEALRCLKMVLDACPKELSRIMRHVAWWLQNVIKEEMRAEAPGGRHFAALREFSRKKTLELAKEKASVGGFRLRAHRDLFTAFGGLIQAIGYRFSGDVIKIGWTSPSAITRARKLQAGFERPLTPRMRRMFFAAGIPLGAGKRQLKTPGRSVIREIAQQRLPEIPERVRERLFRAFMTAERAARS